MKIPAPGIRYLSVSFALFAFLSLSFAVPHSHFYRHPHHAIPRRSLSAGSENGLIFNSANGNKSDRDLHLLPRRGSHSIRCVSSGTASVAAMEVATSTAPAPSSIDRPDASLSTPGSPPKLTATLAVAGPVYVPNPHERVHNRYRFPSSAGPIYPSLPYSYQPSPTTGLDKVAVTAASFNNSIPGANGVPNNVSGTQGQGSIGSRSVVSAQPGISQDGAGDVEVITIEGCPCETQSSMLSAPATPSSLPAPQPASSLSSSFAAKSSASSSSIQSRSQAAGVPQASPVSMRFAASSQVIAPGVARSNPLGSSSNQPTSQYIQIQAPPAPQIASDLLTVGVDGSLSTAAYGLAPDTGVLLVNDSTQALITDLSAKPHLSRDGGKGGYLNGQKLFVFCDTGSYTQPSQSSTGNFLGFVSSSVAIDVNMSAAQGLPLTLEDGIGEWSDNQGRMRGLSPLTSGEQGYNDVMQGQGQRYAVWPESSLIPYNQTSALMYAPIVYDNVNEVTRQAVFTYTGTTLLVITAHTEGGPSAERVVDKLFEENEVEWGTIGGLRSYGPSGVGGNDGKVYLFGTTTDGLLLARVAAGSVTDRNSYEYWTGFGWSPGMQANNSEAHFVSGAFTSGDIFYSPAHLTFIFVFLNPYADNTFYFQYLLADHALLPPSAPGGDPTSDIAENLVKYGWSEPQVLYKAPAGPTGMYIYAGGVHQGYFDEDDITNGGKRVLLSWTVPTGANPGAQSSEYSLMTADLTFA